MWHPDTPIEYRNAIVTGDARVLSERIPDESVDLVFTDPPYLKEYIPLYGWLANEAARVLKPGGFCIAMCGGLYLNQLMRLMDEHLTFFWKYEVVLTGWAAGCIWPYGNTQTNIVTRSKPLLAYSKGISLPRTSTLGLFNGTGSDKRYHAWGQDEASTRYYVDCFSKPGDVVLDPFCGGGTTPAMCKVLRRDFVAFDIDPVAARGATERLECTVVPWFAPEPEQAALGI